MSSLSSTPSFSSFNENSSKPDSQKPISLSSFLQNDANTTTCQEQNLDSNLTNHTQHIKIENIDMVSHHPERNSESKIKNPDVTLHENDINRHYQQQEQHHQTHSVQATDSNSKMIEKNLMKRHDNDHRDPVNGVKAEIDFDQLRLRVKSILLEADLSVTSAKSIRKQLEKEMNMDLSLFKKKIKKIVEEEVEALASEDDHENEEIDHQCPKDITLVKKEEEQVEKKARSILHTPVKHIQDKYIGKSHLSSPVVFDDMDERELTDYGTDLENHSQYTDEQLAKKLYEQELNKSRRVTRTRGNSSSVSSSTSKRKNSTKSSSNKKSGVGGERKKNSAFHQLLLLSPQLSNLLQEDRLSRPEVVKRIWAYVKERDMQDPSDRRFILCDDKLQQVFGTSRVNGFKMNKILSDHLKKPDEVLGIADSSASMKKEGSKSSHIFSSDEENEDEDRTSQACDIDTEERKTKKMKKTPKKSSSRKGGGGGGKLYHLSEPMQQVCISQQVTRFQLVKELWVYIKANDLQDPSDKRFILCDDKLKAVFKCNRINSFKMSSVSQK